MEGDSFKMTIHVWSNEEMKRIRYKNPFKIKSDKRIIYLVTESEKLMIQKTINMLSKEKTMTKGKSLVYIIDSFNMRKIGVKE